MVESTSAQLDLLIEFMNTVDEEAGEDELPDDDTCAAWLSVHGLPAAGVRAAEAQLVRTALRAAADGGAPPGAGLEVVPLHATVTDDGDLVLTSEHPLGPLVATAVRLAYEGNWARLKLCDAHTCRYAYYDASRNRSGRWCSMAVCGNRAKTRAFRDRHR